LVAEARGLGAASSRSVASPDAIPGGVLPAFGARKAQRRWMTAKVTTAIAATLVIAAGTIMTVRGRDQAPIAVAKLDTAIVAPAVKQPVTPSSASSSTAVPLAVSPQTVAHSTAQKAALTRETQVASRAATEPKVPAAAPRAQPSRPAAMPVAPAVADSQLRVAATASVQPSPMTPAMGGAAQAKVMAPRRNVAMGASVARVMDASPPPPSSYAGCYEVNESTDVLPKRFALRADSTRAGFYDVRYVDSTGAVDGRMVDAGWLETGGRAVIRTARLGNVLTIARTETGIAADSPLGPRTVRVTGCR